MKISMIVAALPPELDGIGDYTALLCTELARTAEVNILTASPNPNPVDCVEISTMFSVDHRASVNALEDRIAGDKPDWIVLQYCPFSYGRWGLNLHLPEVIRRIKRRLPSTKFALMVHEPFVPINSLKLAIMTSWQRWQLRRLGQASDLILFTIQPWRDKFSKWFPGKMVRHLPVGSNIDPVTITRHEARRRLEIPEDACVLGIFGWMHDSRMMDWVVGAAEGVGERAIVLYLGPNPDAASKYLSAVSHIAGGPFPADEISRRFAAIDINLSAFNDGISTRRGSLMCALAHGTPTVGSMGYNTDRILLENDGFAFLLADTQDQAAFCRHVAILAEDTKMRAKLSVNAQRFYKDEFDWTNVSRTLLAYMSGESLVERTPAASNLQRI